MSEQIYHVLVIGARYWFCLALIYIVFGVVNGVRKEYRYNRFVRQEAQARFAGIMEVVEGPEEIMGRRYGLKLESIIGRGRSCDVNVEDASISRSHCRIYFKQGKWYVEDAGSRNGTFLNGKKVSRPKRIYHRDILKLGDVEFDMTLYEQEGKKDA
ncbi:FHA domain-containing protein [Gehongia tenuis]|jgi:hypothetical protein|uniref:FHA domain-containing protein n=1 Tax=Gehongia tenuis TaxID=2763655 RepID=A0A926HPM7_9FIRM|nr:FHA domain-containing protein [Gehongia tenuis]MBC8531378.1 FHA domain-containing protein [Gehongia tenuis]